MLLAGEPSARNCKVLDIQLAGKYLVVRMMLPWVSPHSASSNKTNQVQHDFALVTVALCFLVMQPFPTSKQRNSEQDS